MSALEIERYSRGSTASLFLEILAAGVGQTGEAPTVAIQRLSDSQWFDGATFVPTIQENALIQKDQANLPGVYYFDFDHALDATLSEEFLLRFRNTGANALLDHRHIIFGRLTDVVDPDLCAITGTIYTATGRRAPNTVVRATVIPVVTDTLGRGFQNVEVVQVYSDPQGEFELSLVRSLNVRLEIPDIGYDRKICVPDQASALFTAL
ncbi:MAG TPA: hypothetical protein VMW52_08795 [Phycisphaerae bacterium]|nr:hypothetical protein [Phycisphaerae bacterium]